MSVYLRILSKRSGENVDLLMNSKQKQRRMISRDHRTLDLIQELYGNDVLCEADLDQIFRDDFQTTAVYNQFINWKNVKIQ